MAGAALDEDRLLWIPGRKVYSIPVRTLTMEEFAVMYLEPARKAFQESMEREIIKYLSYGCEIGTGFLHLKYLDQEVVDSPARAYRPINRLTITALPELLPRGPGSLFNPRRDLFNTFPWSS